jgi:hypothetical protein
VDILDIDPGYPWIWISDPPALLPVDERWISQPGCRDRDVRVKIETASVTLRTLILASGSHAGLRHICE